MNKKQYVIYVNNESIEVSQEIYQEYWKSVEHERYLSKQIRKTWIYLDHLYDEYEQNSLEFKLIKDHNPTATEAIKQELIERMLQELQNLPQDEQDLIYSFYFEGNTHTDHAKNVGLSQQAISQKHKRIIEKLRKILKF